MSIDTMNSVRNISTAELPRTEHSRLSHGGLAGGLREWLEDQAFHILAGKPSGFLPVVVDMDIVGCGEDRWISNDVISRRNAKGADTQCTDIETARDILVRKLFDLQIATGNVNPRRSFEAAIEVSRLSNDTGDLVSFLRTCKPAVVTRLKREVEYHASKIVSHWDRIPGYMYPRTHNRYTISCHGGELVFTGVCDLILATPGNVIINVCTDVQGDDGDISRGSHDVRRGGYTAYGEGHFVRRDGRDTQRSAPEKQGNSREKQGTSGLVIDMKERMRYLALLSTLRDGIPPDAVARWYSATGRFEIDAITEDVLKEALEGLLKMVESGISLAGQVGAFAGVSRSSVSSCTSQAGMSVCTSQSGVPGDIPAPMRHPIRTVPKSPEIVRPSVPTTLSHTTATVDAAELTAWRRRLDRMVSSGLVGIDSSCDRGIEISGYHIGLFLEGNLDILRVPAVAFHPSPLMARKAIGITAIERYIKDIRAHAGRERVIDLARYIEEVLDMSFKGVYARRCGDGAATWRSSRHWWAEWYTQLSSTRKALVKAEAINWVSNAWPALRWMLLPPTTEFGPSKACWRLPYSDRLRVAARWDLKVRYPSGGFSVLSILDGSAPSRWEEALCLPMLVHLMNGNPDKVGGLGGVPVRSVGIWLGSGQVRTCDISWELLERTATASLNTLKYINRP